MKTYQGEMEMKDLDEFEYDVILQKETERESSFQLWSPCFSMFELLGRYCCSEYGKSLHFTGTVHSLVKRQESSNVAFIDDLVHGNVRIDEVEASINRHRQNGANHFILCCRLEGKLVDHIVVMTFDFKKNKITYFDSKGINPFGDIRTVRGLVDTENRQLRPVNLCSAIKKSLSDINQIAPVFVYNTDKVQSWWDFWSCGIHSLVYIEKDLLYDLVMP